MKFDHTHTDRSHLSEEDLYRYLEGTPAREERKRLEAHLKDCELCSDMLEGFESAGGVQAFRRDMEVLRATIREKTQVRKKKAILFDQPFSVRTVVALAACLLAAVALSMFLFLQKEDFVKSPTISLAKKQQAPISDGGAVSTTPEEVQSPALDRSAVVDKSEQELKASEPPAVRSEQVPENTAPSGDAAPIVDNKNAPSQTLGELQQPAPKDKEFNDADEQHAETSKVDANTYDDAYRKKAETAELASGAAAASKMMPTRAPQPEGGYEALVNYLQEKLALLGKAALSTEKNTKQQSSHGGKTRAAEAVGKRAYFYVEPDGRLTGFEITGETDKQQIEKVIEALRKGPAWKPAYKNGKPVRQRVSVPIEY